MKTGKILTEPLECIAKQLDANHKMINRISVKKGTLDHIILEGRRLLKYTEQLEAELEKKKNTLKYFGL